MTEFLSPEAEFWKTILLAVTASIGAVLGIINTLHNLSLKRVRIKVRPAFSITVPNGDYFFSIEVINLSAFPMTVAEVGFTGNGGQYPIMNQLPFNPVALPKRLDPRESISILFDPSGLLGKEIGKAYVRTSCGEVIKGTSPALKQFRKILIK